MHVFVSFLFRFLGLHIDIALKKKFISFLLYLCYETIAHYHQCQCFYRNQNVKYAWDAKIIGLYFTPCSKFIQFHIQSHSQGKMHCQHFTLLFVIPDLRETAWHVREFHPSSGPGSKIRQDLLNPPLVIR